MKKILKYILSVAVATTALTSCNDFLTEEPTNAGNAATAIRTQRDAEIAVNGMMRRLSSSSYYGRNLTIYGDCKGGDLTIYMSGRGLDGLYTFNHHALSGSYSGFWTQGYNIIMQANNLIQNVEKDYLEKGLESDFAYYYGQALAVRAMVYFDLVRLYGLPYNMDKTSLGVPKVTAILDASATPARASVEEIYSLIVEDLNKAEIAMSGDKKHKNGKVNYLSVKAVQARVYLYMEKWQEALDAAEAVISSGAYSLYENDEWVDSWGKQYGSESIFELCIDSDNDPGSGSIAYYTIAYGAVKNAMGNFLASQYFLDRLGEDPDDVRWGVMGDDEYAQDNKTSRPGACYKYAGGLSMAGDGKETMSAVNIKVIRFSEVYLIAAEAALNSGDKKKAADYLNEIRKRAPKLTPADESTITLDMILNERSKELYLEGHRFFDMIRCNREIEFNDDFCDVPVSTRPKTITREFGKIVLPIDQDELNANPALRDQQNPAYK